MGLPEAVHLVVLLAPAVLLLVACVDLLVFFHGNEEKTDPRYLEGGDVANTGTRAS